MKHWKLRRGKWLLVLGAALTAFSLVQLLRVDSLAQYIACAPVETDTKDGAESALTDVLKRWETASAGLTGTEGNALVASAYYVGFMSDHSSAAEGTLTGVEAGYASVYPKYLLSGRWFSAEELRTGARVVVLDRQLAFKLFPSVDASSGKVMLGDEWYQVIGVVRHERQAGDVNEFGAYAPLRALALAGYQTQYLTACVQTGGQAGVARALNEAAVSALGEDGNQYDLSKEVMRWTMLLRVMFLLFAFYALFACMRGWKRALFSHATRARTDLKTRYLRDILLSLAGRAIVYLALFALLILSGYLLLRLTIQPMYVFAEWVPEVVVEWSSYTARINALLGDNARTLVLRTPEISAIRVYGSLLRWGVICLLCGAVLIQKKVKPGA